MLLISPPTSNILYSLPMVSIQSFHLIAIQWTWQHQSTQMRQGSACNFEDASHIVEQPILGLLFSYYILLYFTIYSTRISLYLVGPTYDGVWWRAPSWSSQGVPRGTSRWSEFDYFSPRGCLTSARGNTSPSSFLASLEKMLPSTHLWVFNYYLKTLQVCWNV